MNKIVNKKNTRRDKRAFADQLANEAEEAANTRDMGALHKITRRCRARQKCSTVVRVREGRILTTGREKAARWFGSFKSVLNQPYHLNTVTLPLASKDLEISKVTTTAKR